MDITQLPFNQLIGIQKCEDKEGGIFALAADSRFHNHVETVHASALFSLAEASGGAFLSTYINIDHDNSIPLLRRANIKYIKPAIGYIYTKGIFKEEDWESFHKMYARRKRGMITFSIELLNQDDEMVALANCEWFITNRPA